MHVVQNQVRLSASDLANHLSCAHLTQQERRRALGDLEPPHFNDTHLAHLQQLGLAHEAAYLADLKERLGLDAIRIDTESGEQSAADATIAAMRAGAPVIVQATLRQDPWHGRADVLLKTDAPSDLGEHSYEVIDTKLSRETRGETILQLCLYTELVAGVQGAPPERMGVVTPGNGFAPLWYRPLDYMAYFRRIKRALIDATASAPETYPEPVPHCDLCRWFPRCNDRRHADDHLCLVAGITSSQRRELTEHGVDCMADLAALPLPLTFTPSRGAKASYEKAREQARVQVAGRDRQAAHFELLPLEPERGLGRLPPPSPGDVYFDIEGDPYADEGGLEYLLGAVHRTESGTYEHLALWAFGRAAEKAAFEAFVRFVEDRRRTWPDLHIYHFDHYEPSAIKRLMGRYATCEDQIDDWLRRHLFVDLHRVVREALIASVERYSLKDLEVFHGYRRAVDLRQAGAARAALERAVELKQTQRIAAAPRETVLGYNRDDCDSTVSLHLWLETLRRQRIDEGDDVPRPDLPIDQPSEAFDARRQRILALIESLTADVPLDESERTAPQHARWLLAHCLDYFRREDKVSYWEKFRFMDLDAGDYVHEARALGGLTFVEELPRGGRRYRFPPQECTIRDGANLLDADGDNVGTLAGIDLGACTVDIEKARGVHPAGVFEFTHFNTRALTEAVERIAGWTLEHGIDAPGPYRAARDLLLEHAPRLSDGSAFDGELRPETLIHDAQSLCRRLDHALLPIQGPPGSGKTYLGARLILDLVAAGKRVGVCANSHKVIHHLLRATIEAAREERRELVCAAKPKQGEALEDPDILPAPSNDDALAVIMHRGAHILGGTKFMWAREAFADAVDVLVVDEASQLALADTLAISHAAASLVLLGDPMQLEQPQQASHPPGVDVSPLDHLLDGHATLPRGQGIFMPETRRLHPALCAYTSEFFYEGRLGTLAGLERQRLDGCPPLDGAGLYFTPVLHAGNQSSSSVEVAAVARLIDRLTAGGTWTDPAGVAAAIGLADILVVTPYNAQVSALLRAVPGARAGTVDKFQGQEAPVVIYSLATSSGEEAPRGMEFLYSANRLNVATSRAKCAVILVASPKLFDVRCRTPAQMRLANSFYRYLEMATVLDGE